MIFLDPYDTLQLPMGVTKWPPPPRFFRKLKNCLGSFLDCTRICPIVIDWIFKFQNFTRFGLEFLPKMKFNVCQKLSELSILPLSSFRFHRILLLLLFTFWYHFMPFDPVLLHPNLVQFTLPFLLCFYCVSTFFDCFATFQLLFRMKYFVEIYHAESLSREGYSYWRLLRTFLREKSFLRNYRVLDSHKTIYRNFRNSLTNF